jgi:DNA polymerase-3 subunit epsilon
MKYFIIDTETTGLKGQVVEIAVANAAGDVVFHSFVKPTEKISPTAREVHGILDSMLDTAPGFMEVAEKIGPIVGDYPIYTYNADYDKQMCINSIVRSAAITEGKTFTIPDWIARDWRCVMLAYAEYFNEKGYYGPKWQKLLKAAKTEKVSFSGIKVHSAAGDAVLTARLLQKDWTKKLKNVSRETQNI